jgi:hypothetical protein
MLDYSASGSLIPRLLSDLLFGVSEQSTVVASRILGGHRQNNLTTHEYPIHHR